jgi:protoporphyrinogen oxidase
MRVAIIGAGFTGLSAGYYLSKKGVDVTIFETASKSGGLAVGFKEDKWRWSLEAHYHHLFTSDNEVLSLAKEIGQDVVFKRPATSSFVDNKIYQLDSVNNLLKFPKLAIVDRIRTGLVLFYLKYMTSWKPLEKYKAEKFIKLSMGKKSWEVLWEPLFASKFRKFASRIPASWFWARIKKRSARLGYPIGGFQAFSDTLQENIESNGGKFIFGKEVTEVIKLNNNFMIRVSDKIYEFDMVVCTLPTRVFTKIVKGLSKKYINKMNNLVGIGAINMVLSLRSKFIEDGSYWLSINDKMPFVAVVEHTNFMKKENYNNEHLIYVGSYLSANHKYFKLSKDELLTIYLPYLRRINNKIKKSWINRFWLFKAKFAQPIVTLNYSKKVPKMKTPIEGLYLANMQQVYPWDRGTNYAVELGKKAAKLVLK